MKVHPIWCKTHQKFGVTSRHIRCSRRDKDKRSTRYLVCIARFFFFYSVHSGNFEMSREKRNVYYHPWKTCITSNIRDFSPRYHVTISDHVKNNLQDVH